MQKERAAGVVWKLHTPCLEATCQALRSTPSSASLLAITGGASSGAEATGGHCSRVRPGLTDAGSRSRNAPASPEDVQRRERCANLRVAAFCCESKCGEVREVGPSKCVGARRSAEAAPRRGELPRVMPRVVPCSAWPGALLGGVRNVYQRTSKPISHCDIIYQNVISGAASATAGIQTVFRFEFRHQSQAVFQLVNPGESRDVRTCMGGRTGRLRGSPDRWSWGRPQPRQ
jgi:hypothetical protein